MSWHLANVRLSGSGYYWAEDWACAINKAEFTLALPENTPAGKLGLKPVIQ